MKTTQIGMMVLGLFLLVSQGCGSGDSYGLFGINAQPSAGAPDGEDPGLNPGGEVVKNNPLDDGENPNPSPSASPTANPTASPTATATATPVPTATATPVSGSNSFVQSPASSKADIVWVIDSSGSMDEEQTAIAENAESFVGVLTAQSINFRLIVVSTNADELLRDGQTSDPLVSKCRESPDQKWLDSSSISLFGRHTDDTGNPVKGCAEVGVNGSGAEEGLEAARRALDPNYPSVGTGRNPNFLRSDADLHLIMVSDEEDEVKVSSFEDLEYFGSAQGTTITQEMRTQLRGEMTLNLAGDNANGRNEDNREIYFPLLANHLNFFRNTLGKGDRFKAHAITLPYINLEASTDPDPAVAAFENCHIRDNEEEASLRYPSFAQMTNGTRSDLCGTWSDTMISLGNQVAGKCFGPLSHTPIAGSVTALVNGAASAIESVTGMSVCLVNAPAPSASIQINYLYIP